jgi:hypothetical protein
MTDRETREGLTPDELEAESATALPDKEVVSILDINADLDLAIDLAAPIDLAVAANANVAAPINAAASANVLSDGSSAQAMGDQGALVTQNVVGDATATADQASDLDQGNDVIDDGSTDTPAPAPEGGPTNVALPPDGTVPEGTVPEGTVPDGTVDAVDGTTDQLLDGNLLNVNVDLAADADIAAPIAGAVAANANVAAPINAGVAANIGSDGSEAIAVAQQDAIIEQNIEGDATANADQDSDIQQ